MNDPELDELKREFLAEAQDKVREMQEALDCENEGEHLERVGYIAHQLKGSGGSYGYQQISAEAAEIEKFVETLHGKPAASVTPAIRQHVVNLREEIDRCSRELVS